MGIVVRDRGPTRAWTHGEDENYLRRLNDGRARMDHVTPGDRSIEHHIDELQHLPLRRFARLAVRLRSHQLYERRSLNFLESES